VLAGVLLIMFFFIGFFLLEPIMPSLLTKLTHKDLRGLSMGFYNMNQFVGAFLGGPFWWYFSYKPKNYGSCRCCKCYTLAYINLYMAKLGENTKKLKRIRRGIYRAAWALLIGFLIFLSSCASTTNALYSLPFI